MVISDSMLTCTALRFRRSSSPTASGSASAIWRRVRSNFSRASSRCLVFSADILRTDSRSPVTSSSLAVSSVFSFECFAAISSMSSNISSRDMVSFLVASIMMFWSLSSGIERNFLMSRSPIPISCARLKKSSPNFLSINKCWSMVSLDTGKNWQNSAQVLTVTTSPFGIFFTNPLYLLDSLMSANNFKLVTVTNFPITSNARIIPNTSLASAFANMIF